VADDLVGDREQLADVVLAALRPVAALSANASGRGVTSRGPASTLCRASARQRSGSLEKCSSMASRPSSLARSAVSVSGSAASASSQQRDDRGSAVPCSIQPGRGRAPRARGAPRPAVRASSAAAWKAARLSSNSLALLWDSPRPSSRSQRVASSATRTAQGLERAAEVADGLLVRQRCQRPRGRAAE
jgi:hypothetical protein